MDIKLKRARLWGDPDNRWLLISGHTVSSSGHTATDTTELVIRCETVERWSYHPASAALTVYTPNGHVTVREARPSDAAVPVEAVDELLWQGCVSLSGSPLQHDNPAEPEPCSMCDGTITPPRHEAHCPVASGLADEYPGE